LQIWSVRPFEQQVLFIFIQMSCKFADMIILAFDHPMPNSRVCLLLELSQATSNTLLVQCFQAPSSQPLASFDEIFLPACLGEQGLSTRQQIGRQGALYAMVHVVTARPVCSTRALCNGTLGLVGFSSASRVPSCLVASSCPSGPFPSAAPSYFDVDTSPSPCRASAPPSPCGQSALELSRAFPALPELSPILREAHG
jgi:hypothetical protein